MRDSGITARDTMVNQDRLEATVELKEGKRQHRTERIEITVNS